MPQKSFSLRDRACTNCCVGSSYDSVVKEGEKKKTLSDCIFIKPSIYKCWLIYNDLNTVFLHPDESVLMGPAPPFPQWEPGWKGGARGLPFLCLCFASPETPPHRRRRPTFHHFFLSEYDRLFKCLGSTILAVIFICASFPFITGAFVLTHS